MEWVNSGMVRWLSGNMRLMLLVLRSLRVEVDEEAEEVVRVEGVEKEVEVESGS